MTFVLNSLWHCLRQLPQNRSEIPKTAFPPVKRGELLYKNWIQWMYKKGRARSALKCLLPLVKFLASDKERSFLPSWLLDKIGFRPLIYNYVMTCHSS